MWVGSISRTLVNMLLASLSLPWRAARTPLRYGIDGWLCSTVEASASMVLAWSKRPISRNNRALSSGIEV